MMVLIFVFMFTFSISFPINSYELWLHYKKTFVSNEGFVVDPYNDYRVTSESQGYTMIISALIGDKETFYKVWYWTKKNLKRKDNLFSWVWLNGYVVDKNNATDADLLIAYGLLLAYERWEDENLLEEAVKIISSLKSLIIPICSQNGKDYILLPGKLGFIKNNEISLKVAYYIPFIFKKFYQVFKDPIWNELYEYTYKLYRIENLSTDLFYDLFEKKLLRGEFIDADGLRVLIYSYIDSEEKFYSLRRTFIDVYNFYKERRYIPDKYHYSLQSASKGSSPFCFYYFFGKLYYDEKLIKKFKEGVRYDRKNYYCYALILLTLLHY
ncbi:MAG: hypothetical protein DSY42_01685 [Aquifex sp.]|nr:MAG: hypothetical protein DSY42_01685 [Aquifex sp.]